MNPTKDQLTDRVRDFNALCDSILSAANSQGANGYVVLDSDMIEIIKEHRILNNAVLSGNFGKSKS